MYRSWIKSEELDCGPADRKKMQFFVGLLRELVLDAFEITEEAQEFSTVYLRSKEDGSYEFYKHEIYKWALFEQRTLKRALIESDAPL